VLSSRRENEGCLSSHPIEGHIHTYTPPRQKPAPRALSGVHQRSRAQDLFAHPLKESVDERERASREVQTRKKGQICLLFPQVGQGGGLEGAVDTNNHRSHRGDLQLAATLKPSIHHVLTTSPSPRLSSLPRPSILILMEVLKLQQDIKCTFSIIRKHSLSDLTLASSPTRSLAAQQERQCLLLDACFLQSHGPEVFYTRLTPCRG
jgi:hypothetical protein